MADFEAPKKPTREELLAEVEEGVAEVEANRPLRLDGFAVSEMSKLPFKALNYSDSLIWRMAELSSGALASLRADKSVTGILLTRAAVETSAALWYLCAKVEAAVAAGELGDIDDYLMKLVVGWKADAELPQAINVMTFVDRVNKDIPGVRRQYEMMCEFCHPNWAGTTFIFTRYDETGSFAEYGSNVRGSEVPGVQALASLSGSLSMFHVSYKKLREVTPAFVAVCEKSIRETGAL